MTAQPNDDLVEQWLASVQRAGADLPPDRLGELLADLREHITVTRAELSSETETEADVRTLLERLGDPESIVAEARTGVPHPAAAWQASAAAPTPKRRGLMWLVVTLVVIVGLCLTGGFVAAIGLVSWNVVTVSPEVVDRPLPAPSPAGVLRR